MSLGLTREEALRFRSLTRDEQVELISGMTTAELLRMDAAFDMWVRVQCSPHSCAGVLRGAKPAGAG